MPPMDPTMGGGMGMAGPPVDPMMAPVGAPMAGAPSEYPSTDPAVISQIMAMLGGLQSQDHTALQSNQDAVLMAILQQMGIGGVQPEQGFAEGGDMMLPPEQMAQGF